LTRQKDDGPLKGLIECPAQAKPCGCIANDRRRRAALLYLAERKLHSALLPRGRVSGEEA
jgi:hypothetical protein